MANESPTNQAGSQPDNTVAPEVLDAPFDAGEQAQFEAMRQEAPQPEPAASGAAGDGQGAGAGADAAAAAAAAAQSQANGGQQPAAGDPAAAGAGEDDDAEGDGAAAAAGGEQQPGANPMVKRVSLNKFLRAENARKTLEAEVAELRRSVGERDEKFARADERLRLLTEALSGAPRGDQQAGQQQQDDDPEPDEKVDAFAWIEWSKRQRVRDREANDRRLSALENGAQSTQEDAALTSAYSDDAVQFAQREPNFVPAYRFLMETRIKQMALTSFGKNLLQEGVTLTDGEMGAIKKAVLAEERQLAIGALNSRRSPAESLYVLARTMGFQPQQQQQNGQGGQQQASGGGNGQQRPAANGGGNGAAKPSVQETIDRVRQGQDASVSLSNGGGGGAPPLDAKRLADMPQEEFGALLDQMTDAQFKRIAGGA